MAALSLLALLALMPASAHAGGVHREAAVVYCTAAELAERPIESIGEQLCPATDMAPAPASGRLRVREADRLGPFRLHLPPPSTRSAG